MLVSFVHLRMHTGYSMKNGIIRIDEAIKKAKESGMPALAITDLNNVMAAVTFFEAARKAGIKPIIGIDGLLENDDPEKFKTSDPHKMTFLVQSEKGYHNLNKIISRAYVENLKEDNPLIKQEWLNEMETEGIIALSGAEEGLVGRLLANNLSEEAKSAAENFAKIFKNDSFFIELQRDGHKGQEDYIKKAVDLSADSNVPVVATHLGLFLNPENYEAHDVRVVISDKDKLDNPNRKKPFTKEQYFKTSEEMQDLFSDIPEALENTVEIAKRCNFKMNLGNPELPRFEVDTGESEEELLIRLSREGLEKRLAINYPDPDEREIKKEEYQQRLETELKVITEMGFPGYFLIVQDFINWSKDQGIPVGPGRGSGAGSLVAYSLNITDIDPLPYGLLFERFLNPERVSMPDFDIDFCRERRGEVIDYVRQKYGYNRVSQIATTGAMESKSALKDVCRVVGMSPLMAQELSNLIPIGDENKPVSLETALDTVPKLQEKYRDDKEIKKIFDLAIQLEGTPRQFGMHAAGVVISPREITTFTPLYYTGKDVTSHFDKDDVEKLGLVKFDFLGLDELTIVSKAEKLIKKLPGYENFDISRIPVNDELAYDVFRRGDTSAVFQSEGDGMRKTLMQIKPNNLEDVIAAIALFRPGPLGSGMVDDFISRKHGLSTIEYPHPKLEKILKPTYGVIVYQEQVMQVAQELAGYSLGSADLLRRAMGKKKPEEMAMQREIFTKGAVTRGVNPETAKSIFDLMERFAEYGFNKSHSAAYGWLAYQTAYLKGHFPQQLYAAAMTCKAEDGKFDKVADLVEDARKNGFKILPPDVNKSNYEFLPEGEKEIRFGLSGIKGVGESAALVIQNDRSERGDFKSFFELGARLGKGTVNKRTKDALVNSGAMDTFGYSRETLAQNLETMQKYIEDCEKAKTTQAKGNKNNAAQSAFNEVLEQSEKSSNNNLDYPEGASILPPPEMVESTEKWSMLERLDREFRVFDFYFSGHPYQAYKNQLGGLQGISQIEEVPAGSAPVYVSGVVMDVMERKAKASGNPWASVTISDGKSTMDMTVFGETYQNVKEKIKAGNFITIAGKTKPEMFRDKVQINADQVYSYEETVGLLAKFLKIAYPSNATQETINSIESALQQAPRGGGPFQTQAIVYQRQEGNQPPQRTSLGDSHNIKIDGKVMESIKEIVGEESVKIDFHSEIAPPQIQEKRKFFQKK